MLARVYDCEGVREARVSEQLKEFYRTYGAVRKVPKVRSNTLRTLHPKQTLNLLTPSDGMEDIRTKSKKQ